MKLAKNTNSDNNNSNSNSKNNKNYEEALQIVHYALDSSPC